MRKQTRTARQLQQILVERIEAQPDWNGEPTDVHLGGVRWFDGGPGGPTWTVPIMRSRDQHSISVARVIRQAQGEFDLEED